jgi:hypothetical protein
MYAYCRLCATLLVAAGMLLVGASTAWGQSVVLTNETTEEHCSEFTLEDHRPVGATCTLHVVGSLDLYAHLGISEVLARPCDTEFEVAVNEGGGGYIYHQVLTPEGGFCNQEPCDEAEGGSSPHMNLGWPAVIAEPFGAAGRETMTMTFCIYPHNSDPGSEGSAGTTSCQLELEMTTVGHTHEFAPAGPDGTAPCVNAPALEVSAHWVTQQTANHPDNVELAHVEEGVAHLH